jgi:hypothetical protein
LPESVCTNVVADDNWIQTKGTNAWVNIHSLPAPTSMLMQCFLPRFAELIVVPSAVAATVRQPPGTATRCRLCRCLNKDVS